MLLSSTMNEVWDFIEPSVKNYLMQEHYFAISEQDVYIFLPVATTGKVLIIKWYTISSSCFHINIRLFSNIPLNLF
jgi:hypothetical protein